MPKVSQKSLVKRVEKYILENDLIQKGDHIFVALSGGADSVTLAELLGEVEDKIGFKLSACHFNHKLRGEESDADEKFVKLYCSERNLDLKVGERRRSEKIKSEGDARKSRYKFFEQILKMNRGAKVALAHQKNDLAETLLMNLIRGTGLRGLRSIPLSRKNFIRPLLCVDRKEIEDYLKQKNIGYRTDKSNHSIDFNRNLVRLKIIPEILKINPKALEALNAASVRVASDYEIIDKAVSDALAVIVVEKRKDLVKWDLGKYLKYDKALRREIIAQAIRDLGIYMDISSSHIESIDKLAKRNVGKKRLPLPHSLQARCESARIILSIIK
jgi:tRNA(Ile)-lysidine synthase